MARLDYLLHNKISTTFEMTPTEDNKVSGANISVDVKSDIALEKGTEEYKQTVKEVGLAIVRTILIRLVRMGIVEESALAETVSETYTQVKHELNKEKGNHRFHHAKAYEEVSLSDRA